MPPKAPKKDLDEGLVFIYTCLKHNKAELNIDFAAVGAALNIKSKAAYMRYWRLKKELETEAGTKGQEVKKRKKGATKTKTGESVGEEGQEEEGDEEEGIAAKKVKVEKDDA